VNGNETTDMGLHLNGGDKIEISNGTDITEPYTDSDPQPIAHKTELKGVGAVHLYNNNAQDGEQVTRTGKESGITATVTTKEPVDNIVQYYNVNSNGDKVIALTFDDGPWDQQTDEILDILQENGAKATFFTVGQCISGHEAELKRAAEMGCEIGTHTWDHAEGSGQGVSLIKTSTQERKDEVTKGLQAITDATGQQASTIFRCPGGNFDTSVATDLDGLVTAEIGWNVDTTDWKRPGADVIAQRIQSAGPGNIILMHDGGGDRSQTVAGLKQALPKLKEQGYSFITVQELIEKYPYQEGQSN
jgi:peptidoglycan/xylan/chitin deacetylase (PgdA/CDA1 family)